MGENGNDKTKLEEDICIHVFTVSSAMVGVCLTVIGLIRVVITLGKAIPWRTTSSQATLCCFLRHVSFPTRPCGPAVFGGGI